MEIGINDLDFDGYEENNEEVNDTTIQDTEQFDYESQQTDPIYQESDQTSQDEEALDDRGILSQFLKSRGIEDMSKIKYEDEEGLEEEIDWDQLSNNEKLTILNSINNEPDSELDDSEKQLINAIRSSRMSPDEYIQYIAQRGADDYAQQMQGAEQTYEIDQYSDDELYVTDLITRMGRENITDDEVVQSLEQAKSNPELFAKQMTAIRKEYKNIEDQNRQYALYVEQQNRQEQYNQFAQTIANQVHNFNEFQGFDLNMDQDDKEELYDFIVGMDEAGNSILGKAMNDPATLVKMAWFALHGEQMLDDISDYVKQQVTKVRRESYTKGVNDARQGTVKDYGKNSSTVYRPKSKTNQGVSIDDLD